MSRAASGPHQKKVPKFTLLLCRFSVYLIELCISLLVLDVALLALKITPQGQKIIYRRAQSRSAIVGPIEVQKKSARPQTKEPTTDNRILQGFPHWIASVLHRHLLTEGLYDDVL